MAVSPHERVNEMEMCIRESNGTFRVTITSLAGQELAMYRETSSSLTFEVREVEEFDEAFASRFAGVGLDEEDDFELERVPAFRAEAVGAADEAAANTVATITGEEVAEIASVADEARNNALFHKLSGLRRELATAAKVPPYLIFHDKTLWGMVEKMPADLPSLGGISGVGKSKLEKYGGMFLAALKEGA